ncbi:MAG: GH25 family lysozyme [Candidatus Obscuribacterales bacterium]|nr:GH25 family lysozyme [Candidatus Obscuribacterales bacterium]
MSTTSHKLKAVRRTEVRKIKSHARRRLAPRPYLNGADFSEFQAKIDWTKIAAQKLDFCFLRASHGAVADIMFASHRQNAALIKLRAGFYHFFNPTVSVAAQLKVFLQTVGVLIDTDLPPVVDLESPALYAKIPLKNRLPLIMSFVQGVEKALGVKPIIYCSRNFVAETLAGPGIDTSVLGLYGLWLAEYGVPVGQAPTLPATWSRWAFYQYTDTGSLDGITGHVDRDYFQGTLAELLQLRTQLKSSATIARSSLADFAMTRELARLAEAGMSASLAQMHEWRESERLGRLLDRSNLALVMPDSESATSEAAVASITSIFSGLDVADILAMCFSEKAVQLILEHSYNDYLFWKHVACGLQNMKCARRRLPIGVQHQRQEMFTRTPFGLLNSPEFESNMEKLRKTIAGHNGSFDPEQALHGAYAFELIQSGFVLLKAHSSESAESESARLVINPMWFHLLGS